jgi:exosome complex RNA-binding protein Rrp4
MIQLGDVIFGRLIMTVPDAEPELVCIDAHGKRAGMGILNDGHVFQVPVHHARRYVSRSVTGSWNHFGGVEPTSEP